MRYTHTCRGGARPGTGYDRSRVRGLVFRWLMSRQAGTTRRNKASEAPITETRSIVRAAARKAAAVARTITSKVYTHPSKDHRLAGWLRAMFPREAGRVEWAEDCQVEIKIRSGR